MTKLVATYEGELVSKCVNEKGVVLKTSPFDDTLYSPTDLLAVALGTCVLTMMGIRAQKLGVVITGTEVTVHKEMTREPVLRVGPMTVEVISEHAFDETTTKALEEAGLACPIHRSLHPDVAVEINFTWGKEV